MKEAKPTKSKNLSRGAVTPCVCRRSGGEMLSFQKSAMIAEGSAGVSHGHGFISGILSRFELEPPFG